MEFISCQPIPHNSKRVVVAVHDNGVALQSRPGDPRYIPINVADGLNVVVNDTTHSERCDFGAGL